MLICKDELEIGKAAYLEAVACQGVKFMEKEEPA